MMTKPVKEQFTDITRRAFQQFISDRISDRLKSALAEETASASEIVPDDELTIESVREELDEQGIETTDDELEGYYAVKSILHQSIEVKRIAIRDTKSYCGVLLDNNNRKPICRMRFNAGQKYLGVFDENKHEQRIPIEEIDDIYLYSERLKPEGAVILVSGDGTAACQFVVYRTRD